MRQHTLNRREDSRRGYSLVELVIAVVILAVGILGLAGATSWAVRQVNVADLRTERAVTVQSVLERLKAADFDQVRLGNKDSGGTHTIRPFTVEWSTTEENYDLVEVEVVTVGPGYEPREGQMPVLVRNKADTFYFQIPRP